MDEFGSLLVEAISLPAHVEVVGDEAAINEIDDPAFGERTPSQYISRRSPVTLGGAGGPELIHTEGNTLDEQEPVGLTGVGQRLFEFCRQIEVDHSSVADHLIFASDRRQADQQYHDSENGHHCARIV